MKGWLKVLVTLAVAWLGEWLLAGYLVGRDVIALLLVQRSLSALLLVALLLGLRLFLILVAPAWFLWRIVSWAERRVTARLSAQSNSTVPDKIG